MKKVFAVLLAISLLFSVMAISASAEGAMSDLEQKIMDYLKAGGEVEINGVKQIVKIDSEDLKQAENYFLTNTDELTEADYTVIVAKLDEGKAKIVEAAKKDAAVVKADGTLDLSKMSAEDKTAVLESAKEACAVVDLSLTYTGEKVVITETSTGSVKFENEPVVKTTGANVNTTALVVAFVGFVTLVGAAAITAKKAELF